MRLPVVQVCLTGEYNTYCLVLGYSLILKITKLNVKEA